MILVCRFSTAGIQYKACVTECIVETQNMDIESIMGDHIIDKTNFDVTYLEFFKCKQLKYLPKIYNIFPNLKILSIRHCGLKYVYKENFNNLCEINIHNNSNAISLPHDLFINCNDLKRLSLEWTDIKWMGNGILDHLSKLKNIVISVGDKYFDINKEDDESKFDKKISELKEYLQNIYKYNNPDTLFFISLNILNKYIKINSSNYFSITERNNLIKYCYKKLNC
jgi:hypothetical protein